MSRKEYVTIVAGVLWYLPTLMGKRREYVVCVDVLIKYLQEFVYSSQTVTSLHQPRYVNVLFQQQCAVTVSYRIAAYAIGNTRR